MATDIYVHTSVENFPVGIVRHKVAGIWIDPTGGTIEAAFVNDGSIPGDDDWNPCTWDVDITSPSNPVYTALCALGTDVTLTEGKYSRFLRLTLDDEIAVKPVPGLLSVL